MLCTAWCTNCSNEQTHQGDCRYKQAQLLKVQVSFEKDPLLCNGRYPNDNSPGAWRTTSGPRTGARGESECATFDVSVHEAVDARPRADTLLLPQHCIVLVRIRSVPLRYQLQQRVMVQWMRLLTLG
eukprot:11791-Heterococcus_DN1.PRE.3